MVINDTEIDKEFIKFLCAYYFHWTPEETEKADAYTIECLLTALPLWLKKERESIWGK
jgi:hypothetical protein